MFVGRSFELRSFFELNLISKNGVFAKEILSKFAILRTNFSHTKIGEIKAKVKARVVAQIPA